MYRDEEPNEQEQQAEQEFEENVRFLEGTSADLMTRIVSVVRGVVPFVPQIEIYPTEVWSLWLQVDPVPDDFDDLDEALEAWAANLGLDIDTFLGQIPDTRTEYGRQQDRLHMLESQVAYHADKVKYYRLLDERYASDVELATERMRTAADRLSRHIQDCAAI